MSEQQCDATRLRVGLIRWTKEVGLAASFLTIIPVGGNSATSADLAASLGWFPLIGFAVGGVVGWIIGAVGLLPLTLGIINGCILAPFLRVPFRGSDLPRT